MKNIFKTSKRGIAAILTLCILLGIAGTCVYAASAVPEENPTVTEETIVAAEETTQELVPVMATGCGDPLVNIFGSGYEVTSTSGPWQYISGAGGITGAYNISTGSGYVQMSDGTKEWFHF